MLKGDCNVNQAAFEVGISDIKYFRTQFNKLFGMIPPSTLKNIAIPLTASTTLTGRKSYTLHRRTQYTPRSKANVSKIQCAFCIGVWLAACSVAAVFCIPLAYYHISKLANYDFHPLNKQIPPYTTR
jgi:hypothetical protein